MAKDSSPARASTPPMLPTRIGLLIDASGRSVEQGPPCAGRWLRQVDGSLLPADADTAAAAGLAWAPASPA